MADCSRLINGRAMQSVWELSRHRLGVTQWLNHMWELELSNWAEISRGTILDPWLAEPVRITGCDWRRVEGCVSYKYWSLITWPCWGVWDVDTSIPLCSMNQGGYYHISNRLIRYKAEGVPLFMILLLIRDLPWSLSDHDAFTRRQCYSHRPVERKAKARYWNSL